MHAVHQLPHTLLNAYSQPEDLGRLQGRPMLHTVTLRGTFGLCSVNFAHVMGFDSPEDMEGWFWYTVMLPPGQKPTQEMYERRDRVMATPGLEGAEPWSDWSMALRGRARVRLNGHMWYDEADRLIVATTTFDAWEALAMPIETEPSGEGTPLGEIAKWERLAKLADEMKKPLRQARRDRVVQQDFSSIGELVHAKHRIGETAEEVLAKFEEQFAHKKYEARPPHEEELRAAFGVKSGTVGNTLRDFKIRGADETPMQCVRRMWSYFQQHGRSLSGIV